MVNEWIVGKKYKPAGPNNSDIHYTCIALTEDKSAVVEWVRNGISYIAKLNQKHYYDEIKEKETKTFYVNIYPFGCTNEVIAHSSAADAHARSSMQCLATKKITVIYEKGEFDG